MLTGNTSDVVCAPQPPLEKEVSIYQLRSSFKAPTKTLPCESKPISDYIESHALPNTNFHQIIKVYQKSSGGIKSFFFKKNPINAPVSEIEAAAAGFYKLLAPNLIPETYAVYNKERAYIGVISEEFPDFKSTLYDKLTLDDMKTEIFDNSTCSMDRLNKINNALQKCKAEEETLQSRLNLLSEKEKDLNEKRRALFLKIDESNVDNEETLSQLRSSLEEICIAKKAILDDQLKNIKTLKIYYSKISERYKFTKRDLDNFNLIKGLAISLTCSYIFMEDDLHRKNFSKDGKRFDFDMSLFPLSYYFKDSSLIYFRKPDEKSFVVTANDIRNFPHIHDASPFYWPTNQPQGTSSSTLKAIMPVFNYWLENAYLPNENFHYQSLKNNKVFKHYQYFTLAKYLLTNSNIYLQIAQRHVRDDSRFEYKSLIETMVKQQSSRLAEFENVLLKMPEFGKFFKENYQAVVKELCEDLNKQNLKYATTTTIQNTEINKINSSSSEQIEKICREFIDIININIQKETNTINTDKSAPLESSIPNAPPASVPSTFTKNKKGYEEIKKLIITEMENYKNPGYSAFFGYRRNHIEVATRLINSCQNLKLDSESPVEQLKAIHEILNKLIKEKELIGSERGGTMYKILVELIDTTFKYMPQKAETSIIPIVIKNSIVTIKQNINIHLEKPPENTLQRVPAPRA